MQQTMSTRSSGPMVPPGPAGAPLVGNLFDFLRAEPLTYYRTLWQSYGDLVTIRLGKLKTYLVVDPVQAHYILVKNQKNFGKGKLYDTFRMLVGQGLVTSEGDLWQQQRRLMQPSFTPTAISDYTTLMTEVIQRLVVRWQAAAAQGTVLNMDQEMMQLTMSVIGKAMFGIDLSEEMLEVEQALHTAFTFITGRAITPFKAPVQWPLPTHRRFHRAMETINHFLAERIQTGRQSEQKNLLTILLHAQDEESRQGMSEQQLRDEVLTLFFAGFETTARSLTWAWYQISRQPAVQQKLEAEVDAVLGQRTPTVEDLFRLPYTRMVVDETLRLYPPTAILPRQNREADQLGDYPLAAGSIVFLAPYLIHRHPTFWPDPETFDPERFTPEQSETRPKHAYIPFANGPRICIGNSFALLEMVLAVAMITANFRIKPVDDQPIGYTLRGTMCPTRPLLARLEERQP